jgi:mycobactin peptide synthetase MbtE
MPSPEAEDGYPLGRLIHRAVEHHARQRPDAIAVVHGDEQLTYATLVHRARTVAADLAAEQVGPGVIVPVSLPRSPVLAVSLLGVLMTGAAYAVLDPQWPAERRDELLSQLGAPVLITDAAPELPCGRAWSPPSSFPDRVAFRSAVVTGESPACVFFTSGTTGTPKGSVSTHQATMRLYTSGHLAEFGPHRRMPLAAALPWDGLALEMWAMLTTGGATVIPTTDRLMPDVLRHLIAAHGVNTAWLTSSLLNLFVDEAIESLGGLSFLMTGGERLSPSHVRRLLARHPGIVLLNGYGPAETCVFATTHRVRPEDCEDPAGIPLGRPVPHTEVYVIAENGRCGAGEVGEICIAGDGLATGYLGDQSLTAVKFPADLLPDADVRLYRTGDRGWLNESGVLYFAGRGDRQLKVRGHRVEPAEIEARAAAVPGVKACAVLPVPDARDQGVRLALFFTADEGHAAPSADGLRQTLTVTLPAYLVPASVHRLASLPLTRNGKLDRAALTEYASALPAGGAGTSTGLVGADHRTIAVAAQMADILGREVVSADDGILQLGGTSLDAMRLGVRLARTTGVALAAAELMEAQTPKAIATLIGRSSPRGSGPVGSAGNKCVPLVGMQIGFCLTQHMNADDTSALCPMIWQIEGVLDNRALAAAVTDVVARHESLRSVYRVTDVAEAVVGEPARQPALHELQAASTLDGAREALDAYLFRPLRIMDGEVWRAGIVAVGADLHVFGIVVHHVALDGWSESLLCEDIASAYQARRRAEVPEFDEPAPSLAEVVEEYEHRGRNGIHASQLAYWQDTLRGYRDLTLPVPRSGDVAPLGRAAVTEFVVATDVMDQWRKVATRAGTTPFVVMLTHYLRAVRALTGQDDFVVGVPVAKRAGARSHRAVTCLIDTICIRSRGRRDEQFTTTLDATVEVARRALAAQDVPFHDVVAALNPRRKGGRNPIYQTMFGYQDNFRSALSLDGCDVVRTTSRPAQGVSEILAEVWPRDDGTAKVRVTYQKERVSADFVAELAATYSRMLSTAGRASAR